MVDHDAVRAEWLRLHPEMAAWHEDMQARLRWYNNPRITAAIAIAAGFVCAICFIVGAG